jgi:DNA-binding MarR family transcriptional regulator
MKLESGTTILPPDRSKRLLEAKTAGLPDGALWTYLELAKITNLTGANRWRFVETLAEQFAESPRTIRHYCAALEAAGLIERERGQVAAFTNGRSLPAMRLEHGKW